MTLDQSLSALATAGVCFSSPHVIPAAAGTSALVITCDLGAELPQARDLRMTEATVIGWRFVGAMAEPVFSFDPYAHLDRQMSAVFVRDDDVAGSLVRARDAERTISLPEARDGVLRAARLAWSERQALATYMGALARRREPPASLSATELLAA